MFPWLIPLLTDHYGWRGSVLLISGIFLNICVLSMFFKNRKVTKSDMDTSKSEQLNRDMCTTAEENVIPKPLDKLKYYIGGLEKAKFWMFYIGIMLQFIGLAVVYTHVVAYTESQGYSTEWSSLVVTLIAAFSLCKRQFLVQILASWKSAMNQFYVNCKFNFYRMVLKWADIKANDTPIKMIYFSKKPASK